MAPQAATKAAAAALFVSMIIGMFELRWGERDNKEIPDLPEEDGMTQFLEAGGNPENYGLPLYATSRRNVEGGSLAPDGPVQEMPRQAQMPMAAAAGSFVQSGLRQMEIHPHGAFSTKQEHPRQAQEPQVAAAGSFVQAGLRQMEIHPHGVFSAKQEKTSVATKDVAEGGKEKEAAQGVEIHPHDPTAGSLVQTAMQQTSREAEIRPVGVVSAAMEPEKEKAGGDVQPQAAVTGVVKQAAKEVEIRPHGVVPGAIAKELRGSLVQEAVHQVQKEVEIRPHGLTTAL